VAELVTWPAPGNDVCATGGIVHGAIPWGREPIATPSLNPVLDCTKAGSVVLPLRRDISRPGGAARRLRRPNGGDDPEGRSPAAVSETVGWPEENRVAAFAAYEASSAILETMAARVYSDEP
jgi:hypothetical protein